MAKETTVWEFGEHDLGPGMLVVLPSRAAVRQLRDLFLELARSGNRVSLADVPGMRLDGVSSIDLERTDRQSGRALIGNASGFVWSGTDSYWQELAEMVDHLLESSGHQYLADVPDDDAIIEVSFGEATHRPR